MLAEKANAVEAASTVLEASRAERIAAEIEKYKTLQGLAKPIKGEAVQLDRVLQDWAS